MSTTTDRAVILAGCASALAMLLRPDGALLFVALAAGLFFYILRDRAPQGMRLALRRSLTTTSIYCAIAMAPIAVWTLRNWVIFQVFQPLAPRHLNDPGERANVGVYHWIRTWSFEYVSTADVFWQVGVGPIDPGDLPARAFDSPAQRAQTLALLDEYNHTISVSADLDHRFGALAAERIRARPSRYYIALPLERIIDMMLRPRTEEFELEVFWWSFSDHPAQTIWAILLGLINLLYVAAAAWAFLRRRVPWPWMLGGYIVLRCLLLGTMENSEPRYSLECFPIFIVAAAAFTRTRSLAAGHEPTPLAPLSHPLCDNPHQTDFVMRKYCLFPALVCGLALASVSAHPQAEPAAPLVLAGGTVVDVADWGHSAHDIPDAIVVIREGKVIAVGLPGEVPVPKGARIIDCSGKFLIPGLIDGFAGLNSQAQANANLYMGVTTVVARADYQRGFIDSGAQPSPHIYPIDTIGVTDDWSLLARQPEWVSKLRQGPHPAELSPQDTARQMVDTARLGTRVLLLTPHLTAANSQWIIARAHEMGLVTYGIFVATPYRVGVEAGVDALPQMDRYVLGVIPDELQRPLTEDPDGSAAVTAYDYSEHVSPTDLRLRNYAHFIAAHHAALMPSFSLYYVNLPGHRNLWKEPAAALLDPGRMFHTSDPATGEMIYTLPTWEHHLPATAQRWMEEDLEKKAGLTALRFWRINQTIFADFPHYLAASGADSMGTMPGISLHTELELLVRLGLSPREALAAATNNYALQFGWNELGLIAAGRRADILVVDADPTANIWNARRISTIIFNGEPLDRNSLLHLKK